MHTGGNITASVTMRRALPDIRTFSQMTLHLFPLFSYILAEREVIIPRIVFFRLVEKRVAFVFPHIMW